MNHANKQEIKVALITGGAKRIGAAIVQQLHQAGFQVGIHCHHSKKEADALANTLNQQRSESAFVLQKELGQTNAEIELVSTLLKATGRLDLLVNNASLFARNHCDFFDESCWNALFNINVRTPFLLSLAAKESLSAHCGAIINLTDIHADKPLRDYAVYCQSKAALVMQTKALAIELAPRIRVNAVAPGAIIWPEADNALHLEIQQKIIAKTPLKRHGEPEFIAQAVLALATNPFITGQILAVDGGRSL